MKFKKYELEYHKKRYNIYIPLKVPKDFWVYPTTMYGNWHWIDYLDTDRYGLNCIKYTSVILSIDQNSIVYFPTKKNKSINDNCEENFCCYGLEHGGDYYFYDIALYNEVLHFKRSEWKNLLKMIPYTKEKIVNIKCNNDYMYAKAENAQKRWDSVERYNKHELYKHYVQNDIFFVETLQLAHYIMYKNVNEFLKRNLDHEAIKQRHSSTEWFYCFELGYVTRKIFKLWNKNKKKVP